VEFRRRLIDDNFFGVNTTLTAADIIRLLDMKPLDIEGGYFKETYRSPHQLPQSALPPVFHGPRSIGTAIYYLLTPETFSRMHRVPGEEIFHFYLGDPVEMIQIAPDAAGVTIVMGQDIAAGMKLQHVVPGRYWQGARLKAGGKFALLGTTMAPGFEYVDYEVGKREALTKEFPAFAGIIKALTLD
jgi:uncharacterized protein